MSGNVGPRRTKPSGFSRLVNDSLWFTQIHAVVLGHQSWLFVYLIQCFRKSSKWSLPFTHCSGCHADWKKGSTNTLTSFRILAKSVWKMIFQFFVLGCGWKGSTEASRVILFSEKNWGQLELHTWVLNNSLMLSQVSVVKAGNFGSLNQLHNTQQGGAFEDELLNSRGCID